ncbi:MAG TPA: LysR substrate-binding domain-containing protein [Streptosporangiaceae bacterium]|jgi:DNA-binding transcriptional LysR family regulator
MDIDGRLWRSFTVVAEELHYGRAADRLGITQPALSRQVRGLERALGVTLFDRTSRRVALSQAGQAVLGQARRALTESDRAIRLARLAAHGECGELAIAALPAVALSLLPAIIRAYRDTHPSTDVTISESFDDEQLAALAARRIDAGFLRAAEAPPGIRLQTLLTEPVVAVLPSGHRLARHSQLALSELAGEPFVFFPRHRSVLAYDEFIASCRAAGFSPAIVQEASGISALGLVAAGLGVSVLAASYQALSVSGVRFVPVAGHQLALQAGWAADNTNTALPGFLDTARRTAAQAIDPAPPGHPCPAPEVRPPAPAARGPGNAVGP